MNRTIAAFLVAASPCLAQSFRVTFMNDVREAPATGRLVVYLIAENSSHGRDTDPADGPFFDDPQPMFGIDAVGVAPGQAMLIDDSCTSFPVVPSKLPFGMYRAQAVLDLHRDNSSWRREPGNLYSTIVTFTHKGPGGPPVVLTLESVVEPKELAILPGSELVEVRSELLSAFHGRDVFLRAGVMLPHNLDGARAYPAVYEIPGFGGDHSSAFSAFTPYRARLPEGSPWLKLRENAAWVVLDPEGPNGHHLFADSANNGPVAKALVTELIPEIERRCHLIASPEARLLRGHSSGGWATLWLALHHPETFGACWSSSPDPVDFHAFQASDLSAANVYFAADGSQIPSFRVKDQVRMTVLQENQMEEVIGPDNTSGQQWDSWFAVFGPRNERGNPAAAFDPATGVVDRAIADTYGAFDIGALLQADTSRFAPIFQDRIRLIVGDQDNFYLDRAVSRVKEKLEKGGANPGPDARGYIKILPGFDHGSIFGSPELRGFPQEMVDHLTRAGLVK